MAPVCSRHVPERRFRGERPPGRRQRHESGTTLFQQGEPAGSMVLLERGCVKVTHVAEDGRESLLAVRGPGDVLGELAVLSEGPRSATVTALEPVVSLSLPAAASRAVLAGDGRLCLAVLRVLDSRLREADRTRVEFAALDASARLALRLLELSCRYGQRSADGTRTCSALTQDELAAWVGSSREAVTKALRKFRDQGWITTYRRWITVHDDGALRRHVGRRQRTSSAEARVGARKAERAPPTSSRSQGPGAGSGGRP